MKEQSALNQELVEQAITELSLVDETMRKLFSCTKPIEISDRKLNFQNTARIIINQQLSGRAADTIFGRVLGAVGKFTPSSVI